MMMPWTRSGGVYGAGDGEKQTDFKITRRRGTQPAQSEKHVTLDLGVMSLGSTLGVDILITINLKKNY